MDLVAIDTLLTLVQPRHTESVRAWTQAALFACELAEQNEAPLWQVMPEMLESAGWLVDGASQQAVALPQLAVMLRADPVLAALLDRRGGVSLPEEASSLIDGWWQRSLVAPGDEQLHLLVGTLTADDFERPRAQLYVITLPVPTWRWMVRAHLVQARLQRLTMRLDERRNAAMAATLAERSRERESQVHTVALEMGGREHDAPGLAPWLAY
jgi:hypothetical protein